MVAVIRALRTLRPSVAVRTMAVFATMLWEPDHNRLQQYRHFAVRVERRVRPHGRRSVSSIRDIGLWTLGRGAGVRSMSGTALPPAVIKKARVRAGVPRP